MYRIASVNRRRMGRMLGVQGRHTYNAGRVTGRWWRSAGTTDRRLRWPQRLRSNQLMVMAAASRPATTNDADTAANDVRWARARSIRFVLVAAATADTAVRIVGRCRAANRQKQVLPIANHYRRLCCQRGRSVPGWRGERIARCR